MARLVPICQAFAAQASPLIGADIVYPDPGTINGQGLVWVLNPVSAPMSILGGSQQQWLDQLRLDALCSFGSVTQAVLQAIHATPERVADAFMPGTTSQLVRLGGLVNHCYFRGYEFGEVERNGAWFAVGRFSFDIKRSRFAGED